MKPRDDFWNWIFVSNCDSRRSEDRRLPTLLLIAGILVFGSNVAPTKGANPRKLSLWIDKKQCSAFIGLRMEIYIVKDGHVAPYLLQPGFIDNLPGIPSHIDKINLTWTSGRKEFTYWFSELGSLNEHVLYKPLLSIPPSGTIPTKTSVFQITIPCTGFRTGVAKFLLGLKIINNRGNQIRGSPLQLTLKKYCRRHEESDRCNGVCQNGGRCDEFGHCECATGFHGEHCDKDMCFSMCENNSTCMPPGRCKCRDGFMGRYCGIVLCPERCQNGGHCAGRGICWCMQGFYGDVCQYSLCKSPCKNSGICVGPNKCQCRRGFKGDDCAIAKCSVSCGSHGVCVKEDQCRCQSGWRGRHCHRRTRSLRNREVSRGSKKTRTRKSRRRSRKTSKYRLGRKKKRRLLATLRGFARRKARRRRGRRYRSRRTGKRYRIKSRKKLTNRARST